MRSIWRLAAGVVLASAAAAQDLPQAVELLQRLDQLYPKFSAKSLAVDVQGNIYVAGGVFVMPQAAAVQAGNRPKIAILPPFCPEGTPDPIPDFVTLRSGPLGCSDVIVLKLDPSGQQIIYGTAVGGTKDDSAYSIRVDAVGNVYVLGGAASQNFPATSFQGTGAGCLCVEAEQLRTSRLQRRIQLGISILCPRYRCQRRCLLRRIRNERKATRHTVCVPIRPQRPGHDGRVCRQIGSCRDDVASRDLYGSGRRRAASSRTKRRYPGLFR